MKNLAILFGSLALVGLARRRFPITTGVIKAAIWYYAVCRQFGHQQGMPEAESESLSTIRCTRCHVILTTFQFRLFSLQDLVNEYDIPPLPNFEPRTSDLLN